MPSGQVIPHYEAGTGIRPPRKSGRFRAVTREIVPGGGLELWHCDHDHAPGVRNVRDVNAADREAALQCAEGWLADRITAGDLPDMPVVRDGEEVPVHVPAALTPAASTPVMPGPGISAIAQARQALADGTVPVPDCDLVTAVMETMAAADADRRIERLALAGGLVALLIDQREGLVP